MKLIIDIDPERITVGDLRKLQAGSWENIINMLVKFAVDESGEPIPADEARTMIDDMPALEAQRQIAASVKRLTDAASPLETKNG